MVFYGLCGIVVVVVVGGGGSSFFGGSWWLWGQCTIERLLIDNFCGR